MYPLGILRSGPSSVSFSLVPPTEYLDKHAARILQLVTLSALRWFKMMASVTVDCFVSAWPGLMTVFAVRDRCLSFKVTKMAHSFLACKHSYPFHTQDAVYRFVSLVKEN